MNARLLESWKRFRSSAVFWSWIHSGLRFAWALLLLPLLFHHLSAADLGMYYLFVPLAAFLPVADSAFSFNIGRFVSYALAGATRLQPQGIDYSARGTGPNHPLLWRLLAGTRTLYGLLTCAVLVVLGPVGTWIVSGSLDETSSPAMTWIAWTATLASVAWELYSGWWNVFLRSLNRVQQSARLSSLVYAVRLALAALFLIAGMGLIAVPLATLIAGTLNRFLARRACLACLPSPPPPSSRRDALDLLAVIWPNSWRVGLKLGSLYLCTVALASLCTRWLGLEINGRFGVSLQLMLGVHGMAAVWVQVKWPILAQLRARQELTALRQILWTRWTLQNLSFLGGAAILVILGPELLEWLGTDKQLVPTEWLILMAVNTFLEMQFATWTTFVATENRIPSLWPTVASSAAAILLARALIEHTSLGVGALVIAPLTTGCLFNYWFWGAYGARSLGTTWCRFVFRR